MDDKYLIHVDFWYFIICNNNTESLVRRSGNRQWKLAPQVAGICTFGSNLCHPVCPWKENYAVIKLKIIGGPIKQPDAPGFSCNFRN